MRVRSALPALALCALALSPGALPHVPGAPARDLTGDELPAGAVARFGSLRLRHGDAINGLAFSSDGKLIATAGEDKVARLWDARTGQAIRLLEGHTNVVRAVTFADRDRVVITSGFDAIRFWDVTTGKTTRALKDGSDLTASALAVSPDGSRLASGGLDSQVRIWDMKNGDLIRRITGHTKYIHALAFSPDGKRIYSGAQDKTVRAFEVETGKEVRNIGGSGKIPSERAPFGLSADGKILAVSIGGSQIAIIGDDARTIVRRLPATAATISVLAVSPDGKTLASGGHRDTIHLFDPESGKKLRNCGEEARHVNALAFSPDGKTLASAEGSAVRLWDVADGKPLDRFESHAGRVACAAVDPTGKITATGSTDGSVFLWDTATGKLRHSLTRHSLGVHAVAFAPRDRLLAVGGRDDKVRLWDPDTGRSVRTLDLKVSGTWALAFTPDGKTLASASTDKVVRLWDVQTWKQTKTVGRTVTTFHALAFSPDGKTLVTDNGSAQVWDLENGKMVRRLGSGRGNSLAYSRDGKTLAALMRSSVYLYETTNWGKVREMATAGDSVLHAVAFSPAEPLVAAAGTRSRVALLWDADTARLRERLGGHEGAVHALAFSPDGKIIVTGSDDGTAVVWDLSALKSAAASPGSGEAGELWEALGSDDATRAYKAMLRFGETPDRAVALLKDRLQPATVNARHTRLVTDLGSTDAAIRGAALAELTKLGPLAEASLRKGLAGDLSPAVKEQLEQILRRLDEPVRHPDRLRWLRGIEVLEKLGTPQAKAVLAALARGVPEAEQTREAQASLKRLEQKDKH